MRVDAKFHYSYYTAKRERCQSILQRTITIASTDKAEDIGYGKILQSGMGHWQNHIADYNKAIANYEEKFDSPYSFKEAQRVFVRIIDNARTGGRDNAVGIFYILYIFFRGISF